MFIQLLYELVVHGSIMNYYKGLTYIEFLVYWIISFGIASGKILETINIHKNTK